MSNTEKLIAVTGATGQQGGAVARHLLARGFKVRALTRDPQTQAAQALAAAGAEVVQADNEDRASLDAAFAGVYGVFSVQSFWEGGIESEIRQGINITDAAKAAGVQHFIYSSVGGAERSTGIPHFESKWQIEQHIQQLGLPATILRPVEFMDNYHWQRQGIFGGSLIATVKPGRKQFLIAVDDIGAFAAIAFENPQEYIGKAIELAGDHLTPEEIADTFSRIIGRPVQLGERPPSQDPRQEEEMGKMVRWFNEKGYQADLPALRAIYPQLQTFDTWVRSTGWAQPEAEQAQQAE
jgi:uncharacterized protein YbjT (DUF2867 family)